MRNIFNLPNFVWKNILMTPQGLIDRFWKKACMYHMATYYYIYQMNYGKNDVEWVSDIFFPKNLMNYFKEFTVKRIECLILFFHFLLSQKIQNYRREWIYQGLFGRNKLTNIHQTPICCMIRMDDYSCTFSIVHLLNVQSESYYHHLNINQYKYSLKDIMNVAYKNTTKTIYFESNAG